MALRRAELLRVLLGVGESAQLVLELLAHGTGDGIEPAALEDGVEAGADLHLADDVLLGGVDRERRTELGDEFLDRRCGLAEALGRDAGGDALAVGGVELLRELGIEPLRLADLAAELLLHLAELPDLGVREVERLEERLLGDLVRARLDHRQALLRADDDQVELGLSSRGATG